MDRLTGHRRPTASWSGRLQPEGDEAERLGLRAAGYECDANAARGFDDAAGDLQETQTDGGELGVPQRIPTWDRRPQVEQPPVGTGVQDQSHLVGERRSATGAIGRQLRLVLLDEVLGLPAGAV